jgi:hypothetical protein
MKIQKLTLTLSLIFFLCSSENLFAQRDAGGYSVGREAAFEQKLTNFPNSFNNSTTIKYYVPTEGRINLKVFNSIGQEITTLINEDLKPGSYTTELNAGNLSKGIYICRYSLEVNNKVSVVTRMLSVTK